MLPVMLWCLFAETSAVTILQSPPDLDVEVGQSAKMQCEMSGAEDLQVPQYYWYLNDTSPEQPLKNSTRITILSNTLIISSVTTNDTGIYVCTARDSSLEVYVGNGTHLLVQDPGEQDRHHYKYHYKYLYGLLLFTPLLILLIYRIFRFMAKTGAWTHDTKSRHRQQEEATDTDLHYSTIFPQTKEMKTRSSREEVEYAPGKIAVPSLSPQETSRMDTSDITYATLKTEGIC